MEDFSQSLKKLRQDLGMSQSDFANHTGISVRTIQDWETGRRVPPDYLPRLLSYQIGYEKICLSHNILIVYFAGSSAEKLVGNTIYESVSLPSDKEKDGEILIDKMSKKVYEYIICFGQKPGICDSVKIEKEAHGEETILSTVNCELLKDLFIQNGIVASISGNPGNSYCNNVYWNGLKYIKDNNQKVKFIFVHVPYEEKISDMVDMSQWIIASVNQLILSK